MILVGARNVAQYMQTDLIGAELRRISRPGDRKLVCQNWLMQSEAKRFVFQTIYADLLQQRGLRILDVGGGLSAFTRELASRHDYVLVDMFAHDADATAQSVRADFGLSQVHICDWHDVPQAGVFDVVIANDLFPNVDQRLDLFLRRYLPISGEIRLSLTYYDTPRFYKTKRIDAEEFLCMLAWDGAALMSLLRRYRDKIEGFDDELLDRPDVSIYPNGRQVCLATLRAGT